MKGCENNLEKMQEIAKDILARMYAKDHDIPLEAAQDVVDEVQRVIDGFEAGERIYQSEAEILYQYLGLPVDYLWVFYCT